jgi:hypothetical protein
MGRNSAGGEGSRPRRDFGGAISLMSLELYYTSADRGLKPHSRGFCTVARTDVMPTAVVERLESLSQYQPLYLGGSSLADRNPVSWSHWKIQVGSRTRSVLSRVAFVGPDYTGRPSKFAHHVLIEPGEQDPQGPVAMMLDPQVIKTAWKGEPELLASRSLSGRSAAKPSNASGELGISTRLARSFQDEPERPLYVVYDPATDLLPTLSGAIALLPSALRWQVTFSTYFTELPAGMKCAWRCVIRGTPSADAARSAQSILIDFPHVGTPRNE